MVGSDSPRRGRLHAVKGIGRTTGKHGLRASGTGASSVGHGAGVLEWRADTGAAWHRRHIRLSVKKPKSTLSGSAGEHPVNYAYLLDSEPVY